MTPCSILSLVAAIWNVSVMNFPNRLEFGLRKVCAFPNDSRIGLDEVTRSWMVAVEVDGLVAVTWDRYLST